MINRRRCCTCKSTYREAFVLLYENVYVCVRELVRFRESSCNCMHVCSYSAQVKAYIYTRLFAFRLFHDYYIGGNEIFVVCILTFMYYIRVMYYFKLFILTFFFITVASVSI